MRALVVVAAALAIAPVARAASPAPLPFVAVSCAATLPVAGAAGVYDVTHPAVTLRSDVCDRLAFLEAGRGFPRSLQLQWRLAEAVFVLAHELGHAAAGPDEHQADCWAAAHYDAVAQLLGIGAGRRHTLEAYVPVERGCP